MMTADEMIAVIKAADEGEMIEFCPKDCPDIWKLVDKQDLEFNFHASDYRVSPTSTCNILAVINGAISSCVSSNSTAQWYGWPGTNTFAIAVLEALKREKLL